MVGVEPDKWSRKWDRQVEEGGQLEARVTVQSETTAAEEGGLLGRLGSRPCKSPAQPSPGGGGLSAGAGAGVCG